MARKINKPRIKVNSFFLDEKSAEHAFADFYFEAINMKSSVDRNDTDDFKQYNDENTQKGEQSYAS